MISMEDRMLGRFSPATLDQESDMRFYYAGISKMYMRVVVESFGAELMSCHRSHMAMDVVGPYDEILSQFMRFFLNNFRPGGVEFRYFRTHQDRLAEFQQRLDIAKNGVTFG
jgi:hypothetical protein